MPPHHTRTPALVIVATLLVLAALLTGCGGKQADKKSTEKSTGKSTGTTGQSGEAAPDPGYGAPKIGECHRLGEKASLASVDTSDPVSCAKPHTTVVSFVGYRKVPISANTPVAQRHRIGLQLCDPAYRRLAGGTLADRATSLLTWTLFTPDQAQLERGARWVRCDVLARTTTGLVQLPDKTPFLATGVPEVLRICTNATGLDVSCVRPHVYKVEAVFPATGRAYPSATRYARVARARCRQLTGSPDGYWQPPSVQGWRDGDTFIRCLSGQPAPPSSSPSP